MIGYAVGLLYGLFMMLVGSAWGEARHAKRCRDLLDQRLDTHAGRLDRLEEHVQLARILGVDKEDEE